MRSLLAPPSVSWSASLVPSRAAHLAAATLALAVAACGSSSSAARPAAPAARTTGTTQAGDAATTDGATVAGTAGTTAAVTASTGASTGASAGPGYGSPGAPGTPGPATAGAAASLRTVAASEAEGMSPVGGTFGGPLAEGQTLRQAINLAPGKCYTIVATGTVEDLEAELTVAVPPMPAYVAAQSTGAGPTAVVGGRDSGCWKNPAPASSPATVVLVARRGAGTVAAQVYVK